MSLLEEASTPSVGTPGARVSGEVAFRLHDTHGFPIELTQEIVAEQELEVDREDFDRRMAAQRERARAAARARGLPTRRRTAPSSSAEGPTVFVGATATQLLACRRGSSACCAATTASTEVFLDRTPFYAESGGQMGDTGVDRDRDRSPRSSTPSSPLPGLHAHRATLSGELLVGQDAVASIDAARREAAAPEPHRHAPAALGAARGARRPRPPAGLPRGARPAALRLLPPRRAERARSWRAVTTARQRRGRSSDAAVETTETSRAEAEQMGAVAFFGDKYGESRPRRARG